VKDATSQGTTHDLLLALAGRVDDDLLSWARELVALGEDARAVEMLTASLVAARAVLPASVRSALVAAAHAARTGLGAATALPPPDPEDGTEHRFIAPDGDDPVAGALLDLPTRPLTGCSVLLARRLTPAGTAPGPLPHPVVLVRVHAGTRPADVLAYQLGAALERAGAPASVEVLPADGPVPDYHAAALDAAVELRGEEAHDRLWRPAPQADRDGARDVAPAPRPARPVAERHSLAPPVDQAPRRLAESAERPAQEAHPLARRDPEPAPERPAGDALGRRTPAPATRHPDEARPHRRVPDRPARRRELDPPATGPEAGDDPAAATERMQPARAQHPERDPEGADSPTALLPAGPGHVHRLDDDYRNDHRDDDPQDDSHHREDFRDDDRDEVPDAHEPEEEAFPEPPTPHPLAPPRPVPARNDSRPARPAPMPTSSPTPGTRPRPTVTPISRPAVPNPIPLVRRNGPGPVPRPQPVTEPRPGVRRVVDDRDDLEPPAGKRAEPTAPRPQEPKPPRGETPAFDSLSDPLKGPLPQPQLAPPLEPTRPEDDPLGLAGRRPEPEEQQGDEWSEEWLSGTWAMAPSALDERADARPGREPDPADDVEPGRPAPRPVPRGPARHRFADGPATANGFPGPERGQADDRDEADDVDERADRDAGDQKPDRRELGLRPESIARLSDADRQLLARLQAELLEGRRQQFARRITNGTGATANGSHRGPPPDLAG
jgi:hypothetical protein